MTLSKPERDLIGGCLTGAITPDQVQVDTSWLSDDGARYWRAVKNLWHRDGSPLNIDALRTMVTREGADPYWLGAGVTQLVGDATIGAVALLAVSGIKAEYEQKQLQATLERLHSGGVAAIPDCLVALRDLYHISSTDGAYMQPISELISEFHERVMSGEAVLDVIGTGWATVDSIIAGVPRGVMTTVAGRPGMGKSAFLCNLAVNVSKAGHRVLMYTLEDTRLQTYLRILSMLSGVEFSSWLRGVNADDARQITSTYQQVSALCLYMCDRPMTVREICDSVDRENTKEPVDMVIVDHVGHVKDIIGGEHYSVISDAAFQLAEQAKVSDVAMVMASQLNREVEREADKMPQLGHLRSTGVIEQVSRMVMLLQRPEYYWPDDRDKQGRLNVDVAKYTSGQTGTIELGCDLSRMHVFDRIEF